MKNQRFKNCEIQVGRIKRELKSGQVAWQMMLILIYMRVCVCVDPVVPRVRTYCFEIVIRKAGLVSFTVGDFPISIWYRCQPRILRNLGS